MEKKYWVPAIERAHLIIQKMIQSPHPLKQTDFIRELNLNKSTVFSLMQTMEQLQWVVKLQDQTYTLGPVLGKIGNSFAEQNHLVQHFRKLARHASSQLSETFQLGQLDGREVNYLAKEEADVPIRIVTNPGMKFPGHATGLGKAMLAHIPGKKFDELFPADAKLYQMTKFTIDSSRTLQHELTEVRKYGIAFDQQESTIGLYCVAAPIFNLEGQVHAAVSCTMPEHSWDIKRTMAIDIITSLAKSLSLNE